MVQSPYLNRLLLALVVLTVLALLAHQYAMDAVLTIDGNSPYKMGAVDDGELGGKSQSSLKRENKNLVLDCQISAGYAWPFCEAAIHLRQVPAGIDLTQYDTMRLWIKATGPESSHQVRVFLRNFNPVYAKVGISGSLKPHELVFEPDKVPYPVEVRLQQFTVSSWWTNEHPVAIQNLGPELDNISIVEVSTGGNVTPGPHRIVVERIELRGKLISQANFRLLLLLGWIATVTTFLLVERVRALRQLARAQAYQQQLKKAHKSLAKRSKKFAEQALHDPLTGVLNREGLRQDLATLSQNAGEGLYPLSLVFADLDHFKSINDGYGHDVGDRVLKQFSELVQGNIGRQDLFARWGGEEFVLFFPSTVGHDAVAVANRVRVLVEAAEWPEGLHVTCSFGVAEAIHGEALTETIKRADAAMYRAKQAGRNRVELELPDTVSPSMM